MELIENVLSYPRCHIYGLNNFMEHSCLILYDLKQKYEFDWIVLSAGLLHKEMDFMNLNWIIFMKEIFKKLGCKSENVLNYLKKGLIIINSDKL